MKKIFLMLVASFVLFSCQKEEVIKPDLTENTSEENAENSNLKMLNEGGVILAVTTTGDLRWYKHSGYQTGSTSWANNGGGVSIGSGWNMYAKVFSAGDGIIYGIGNDGSLNWYKKTNIQSSDKVWENGGAAKKVGQGWQNFVKVFSGGNGVIYAIKSDGSLYWYKHLGYSNGAWSWANGGVGKKIGSGWNMYSKVFSGGNGIIYGVASDSSLNWYNHLGYSTGSTSWANNGGRKVVGTHGWSAYNDLFSVGSGVIYGKTNNGSLIWYKHYGYTNGSYSWANSGSGKTVGTGWYSSFISYCL